VSDEERIKAIDTKGKSPLYTFIACALILYIFPRFLTPYVISMSDSGLSCSTLGRRPKIASRYRVIVSVLRCKCRLIPEALKRVFSKA